MERVWKISGFLDEMPVFSKQSSEAVCGKCGEYVVVKVRRSPYKNGLISPQNFQQLKSRSWIYAYTKGRDLSRKAFWIPNPISSALTPDSMYMLHLPTLPEQAGVSLHRVFC